LQEQKQQTAKARHCRRWQETPETTEKNELSRINRRQRQEQQQATEAWHRRRCLEDGYNNRKANNAYKHENSDNQPSAMTTVTASKHERRTALQEMAWRRRQQPQRMTLSRIKNDDNQLSGNGKSESKQQKHGITGES